MSLGIRGAGLQGVQSSEGHAPARRAAARRRDAERERGRAGGTMSAIERVRARQILDSRGNPTVEVDSPCAPAHTAARRCPRAPPRASSRRPSCATAASAWGGKGVTRAVANVNGEIARALAGLRGRRPGGAGPGADRARRHAQQVAPGRQRDPRRLARRRPRPGRRGGPAAVAPPRRRGRARAAGADDERAQRRRPRRQQGRLPGVHGRAAAGADSFSRVPADGRRGLPRAQRHAARARPGDRGRRRGRLRAGPRLQRGGAGDADRGHRGGRL